MHSRVLLPAAALAGFASIVTGQIASERVNFSAFPPGQIPGFEAARELEGEEVGQFERAFDALEAYVKDNPEYAPQLEALREAREAGRILRFSAPAEAHIWSMKTLADVSRIDRKDAEWLPSGEGNPGGGCLPLAPNTILVNDNVLQKIDPAVGCADRADAICILLHEAGRLLQMGRVDAEGRADCEMLSHVFDVFDVDVKVRDDLVTNGVPVGNGQPNCNLTPAQVAVLKRTAQAARDRRRAICKTMQNQGCSNIPAGCN